MSASVNGPDFRLATYTALLRALAGAGYRFSDFLDHGPRVGAPRAVLRHDVDRLPGRALAMAEAEAALGVRATYFFRTKPCSFDPAIIGRISALGHEIGYHYEDMADADGDPEEAWRRFRANLDRFQPFGPVRLIAMHGRPLSKWNNRELWRTHDYRQAGCVADPSHEERWAGWVYLTDVGRRWDGSTNLRDRPPATLSLPHKGTAAVAADLVAAPRDVIISTHPERWTDSPLGWAQVALTDGMLNMVKRVLKRVRGGERA